MQSGKTHKSRAMKARPSRARAAARPSLGSCSSTCSSSEAHVLGAQGWELIAVSNNARHVPPSFILNDRCSGDTRTLRSARKSGVANGLRAGRIGQRIATAQTTHLAPIADADCGRLCRPD